jgi:hypothetical protein
MIDILGIVLYLLLFILAVSFVFGAIPSHV